MLAKALRRKNTVRANTITKRRANIYKFVLLGSIAAVSVILFLTIDVRFGNAKLMEYAMSIRVPKVIVMLMVAFCIGAASIIFQSVINNTIVTPCLLGMNSLYTLIRTAVVFFLGTGSLIARSAQLSFMVDLLLMGVIATFVYSFIFKKTKYNVLYVLLIGTVMTSFFTSVQTTLVRTMDPNEYDTLLASLVPNISNINSEIILLAFVMIMAVVAMLWKDIKMLDVITLGKEQAINLGVDYDPTIKRLLLGIVLLIAIATAMIGTISFLGLIIANLARQYTKTYRHTYLILASALFGVILLVGGQLVVEKVFRYAVPISVFITVGGGVYFLYLLLTQKRRG